MVKGSPGFWEKGQSFFFQVPVRCPKLVGQAGSLAFVLLTATALTRF